MEDENRSKFLEKEREEEFLAILEGEVEKAIERLKLGKATGDDQIEAVMIKEGKNALSKV